MAGDGFSSCPLAGDHIFSYLSLFFLDVNILMKCSMGSLLLPEGVLKNLRRVLKDEFAVGINVKGLFGKKPLTHIHISMVHFKVGYFYYSESKRVY